jgi:hypothetical protein
MARENSVLKDAPYRPKQIDEILKEKFETALHEQLRPWTNIFLSAISAGLKIGFTGFQKKL